MKSHNITLNFNNKEYSKLLESLRNHYIDRICKYEYRVVHDICDIIQLYNTTDYKIIFNVTIYYPYYKKETTEEITISEYKLNRMIKLLKLEEYDR